MKRNITISVLITIAIIINLNSFAQFHYSAIARDCGCNPIPNKNIGLQINILQASFTNIRHSETQNVTTDANGFYEIDIAYYDQSDDPDFLELIAEEGPFYLQIKVISPEYTTTSVTQLLYLPPPPINTSDIHIDYSTSCNNELEGTVRYLDNGNIMQMCDGTQWKNICCTNNDCNYTPSCGEIIPPCRGITSVQDINGLINYSTVEIGNQCWLAENLNTGAIINSGTNCDDIGSLQKDNNTLEKFCYANTPSNCDDYGAIYQWNEMMTHVNIDNVQGICPNGWHLPSLEEFNILYNYVGGHYENPVTELLSDGATGFNATLHGSLFKDGTGGLSFTGNNSNATFLCSNKNNTPGSQPFWKISGNSVDATGTMSTTCGGGYVRCVKDNCGSISGSGDYCLSSSTISVSLQLLGSENLDIIGKWEVSQDGVNFDVIPNTEGLLQYSTLIGTPGLYVYRAQTLLNGCSCEYTDIAAIRVFGESEGGTLSSNSELLCIGGQVNLNLSSSVGNQHIWQKSSDNVNWEDINEFDLDYSEIVNEIGDFYYRVSVINGPCNQSQSNTVQVNVVQTVGGSVTGGGTIDLCSSTGNLQLTNYSGAVIKWQKRLNEGSWEDISWTSDIYSEVPISTGTWDYRAVVQNNPCETEFSDYTTVIIPDTNPCDGVTYVSDGGETYNTVRICTQCWLKENLKIGTTVTDPEYQTDNSIIERYCYNESEPNCEAYGALYEWGEMMNYGSTEGVRGICPSGWHIPTEGEWLDLVNNLGMYPGIKLQSDNNNCQGYYCNVLGESGFDALLSGGRITHGPYEGLNIYDRFWTSTQDGTDNAHIFILNESTSSASESSFNKAVGASVRCIKDSNSN